MELHEQNVKRIEIKDAAGNEAGALYYIPGDYGIVARMHTLEELCTDIAGRMDSWRINASGIADAADAAAVAEAERELYAAIDYVLGVRTAQEAFTQHRPFAMVDGAPWIVKVVETITRIMKRLNVTLYTIPRTKKGGKGRK